MGTMVVVSNGVFPLTLKAFHTRIIIINVQLTIIITYVKDPDKLSVRADCCCGYCS